MRKPGTNGNATALCGGICKLQCFNSAGKFHCNIYAASGDILYFLHSFLCSRIYHITDAHSQRRSSLICIDIGRYYCGGAAGQSSQQCSKSYPTQSHNENCLSGI